MREEIYRNSKWTMLLLIGAFLLVSQEAYACTCNSLNYKFRQMQNDLAKAEKRVPPNLADINNKRNRIVNYVQNNWKNISDCPPPTLPASWTAGTSSGPIASPGSSVFGGRGHAGGAINVPGDTALLPVLLRNVNRFFGKTVTVFVTPDTVWPAGVSLLESMFTVFLPPLADTPGVQLDIPVELLGSVPLGITVKCIVEVMEDDGNFWNEIMIGTVTTANVRVLPLPFIAEIPNTGDVDVAWRIENPDTVDVNKSYSFLMLPDAKGFHSLNDGTPIPIFNSFPVDKSVSGGSVLIPAGSFVDLYCNMTTNEICEPEMLGCKGLKLDDGVCIVALPNKADGLYAVPNTGLNQLLDGDPLGGTVSVKITDGPLVVTATTSTSPGQSISDIIDSLSLIIHDHYLQTNDFAFQSLGFAENMEVFGPAGGLIEFLSTDAGLSWVDNPCLTAGWKHAEILPGNRIRAHWLNNDSPPVEYLVKIIESSSTQTYSIPGIEDGFVSPPQSTGDYVIEIAAVCSVGDTSIFSYPDSVSVLTDTNFSLAMIPFDGFDGSGVSATPSAGMLDSDDWSFTGFSDGDLAFGDTDTSSGGDYAKGISTGGVFGGGLYAYDDGSNQAMYIQPTGSDWTPGTATLRVLNNSGGDIGSVFVSYTILINNNEERANSFDLSYSLDDLTYSPLTSAAFTSDEVSDPVTIIKSIYKYVEVTGISIPDSSYLYLRWSGDDVAGGGSRDEFGLDDINVTGMLEGGTPTLTVQLSSALESGLESDAEISIGVNVSGSADCSVDINIVGGTAVSGLDYAGSSSTLTFSDGGATSIDFSIFPIDDMLPELTKDVSIQLNNASGACILGTQTSATLVINDDDDALFGDCQNLYFSEYVEGSGNNKAFEIYNPTDAAIDLANYTVQAYNGGAVTPTNQLQLAGLIPSEGVYVIANAAADSAVLSMADTTSSVTFINGDDAIVLLNGSDTIDVIGRVGEDPGANWPVGTGATSEFTLVRNAAIKGGQKDWNIGATEWDVYPQNDFSNLFTHTQSSCIPLCDVSTPPQNPTHIMGASSVQLQWDAVPLSVACRIMGTRIVPPGPSPVVNIFGSEPTSTTVPFAAAGAGAIWEWQVRCACSISPLSTTGFSSPDTFSIPAPKLSGELSMELYPNPASEYLNIDFGKRIEGWVELIDALGTVQLAVYVGDENLLLDVSDLEPGIFFISINKKMGPSIVVLR